MISQFSKFLKLKHCASIVSVLVVLYMYVTNVLWMSSCMYGHAQVPLCDPSTSAAKQLCTCMLIHT